MEVIVQSIDRPFAIIAVILSLPLIGISAPLTYPIDLSYASGSFSERVPFNIEEHILTLKYFTANYRAIRDEPRIIVALQLLDEKQYPVRLITYGMNITKVGSEESLLRYDLFHTENSVLVFDIKHTNGETMVHGFKEPYLNAWTTNPATGNMTLDMPLETNSTYLMHLDVLGIDSMRGFLPEEQVSSIELYFNINDNDVGKVPVIPGKVVVVPEFPYPVVLIISVATGIVIAVARTKIFSRFYIHRN
jgi:hypothetical protein